MLSAIGKFCPVLVACVVLTGGVPSRADAQENFDRALSEAVKLYKALEYEQALEQLQKARRLARGNDQEVAVYLWEGIFLGEMGKPEDSFDSFDKALTLNPEATLPIKVSPKLGKPFEERRAKAIAKRKAEEQERLARESKGQDDRPVQPAQPDLTPREPAVGVAVNPTGEVQASSRVPVAPLVLAGVGVVSAGVGVVFGLQSRSNSSKVQEAYAAGLPPAADVGALGSRLDDSRSQARTANVLFGTAALAAGGAVVTWLLNSSGSETKAGEAH
jgi:tetratricopeptide (TPR) repeat protein